MNHFDEDEDIGYGKPPKKNQFKKGKSGNPKGRPSDKIIQHLFAMMMNEKITVKRGNGESVKMTKKEAILEQLINKSAQGKNGSIKLLLKLLKDLTNLPMI